MATVSATRIAIAAALSAVDGLDIRPSPFENPVPRQGWVVVGNVTTGRFGTEAVFRSVIFLGRSPEDFETEVDLLAIPLLKAASGETSSLLSRDVKVLAEYDVRTQQFALTIALTMEVE